MKVTANPAHKHFEVARAMHGASSSAKTSGAVPEPTPAPAPAPAESTVTFSAKKVPPGLQRVAARLESLGVEGRTPGQSNALTQISRNLQRYVDTQALAPSPVPTPVPTPVPAPDPALTRAPTPVTDAAALAPTGDVALPVETAVGDVLNAEPATKPPAVEADLLPA